MTNASERHFTAIASTWFPISIALASFALSIYTFVITSRPPALEVILPQQIRIAQGADFGYAYAYFAPTLANVGASERIEVVPAMRIELSAPSADGATMEWRQTGSLDYDPATQQANFNYVGDAAPLLLTRQTAASPLGVYFGPRDFYLTPGTWRGELIVDRTSNALPLRVPFTFALTQADIDTLEAGGGGSYLAFAVEPLNR
jgi:hypothetical protein